MLAAGRAALPEVRTEPPPRGQDSNHVSLNAALAPKALKEAQMCSEGRSCRTAVNGVITTDFVPGRNGGRRVCGGTEKPETVPRLCVPFFMLHILGATKVPRGGATNSVSSETHAGFIHSHSPLTSAANRGRLLAAARIPRGASQLKSRWKEGKG